MAKGYWVARVDVADLGQYRRYNCPDYREALKLRLPVFTADLISVEGYAGPQPT
jgi:uncharacterized protein (DUF1330 family)